MSILGYVCERLSFLLLLIDGTYRYSRKNKAYLVVHSFFTVIGGEVVNSFLDAA